MKKMITLIPVAVVALTFAFFAFGCTGRSVMGPMGSEKDFMHTTATISFT